MRTRLRNNFTNDSFYLKTDEFEAAFNNKNLEAPAFRYMDKLSAKLSGEEKIIYSCDRLFETTFREELSGINPIKIRHTLSAAKNETVLRLLERKGIENIKFIYIDREHSKKLEAPKTAQDIVRLEYTDGMFTNLPAYVLLRRYPKILDVTQEFYRKRDIAPEEAEQNDLQIGEFYCSKIPKAYIDRKYMSETDSKKRQEPYIIGHSYNCTDVFLDIETGTFLTTQALLKEHKVYNRTSRIFDEGHATVLSKHVLLKCGTYCPSEKRTDETKRAGYKFHEVEILAPVDKKELVLHKNFIAKKDGRALLFSIDKAKEIISLIKNDRFDEIYARSKKVNAVNATSFTVYNENDSFLVDVSIALYDNTRIDLMSVSAIGRACVDIPSEFEVTRRIKNNKYLVDKKGNVIGEGMYFGNKFYLTKPAEPESGSEKKKEKKTKTTGSVPEPEKKTETKKEKV